MKDQSSIQENELDAALNALFLNTYSQKEDEDLAHFVMTQEYDVVMTERKKKKLFKKVKGKRSGLFLLLLFIGLVATISLPVYFHLKDKDAITRYPIVIANTTETSSSENTSHHLHSAQATKKSIEIKKTNSAPFSPEHDKSVSLSDTLSHSLMPAIEKKDVLTEKKPEPIPEDAKKKLPYFDQAGLTYFQGIKDNLFLKLFKLDYQFYEKINPGSTKYKGKEMLVSPFVISSLPVTNLHYKVFLADLFKKGKMLEFEKCLPKQEVWKEYNCTKLAQVYFESEYYNDFPVVTIGKDAILMFCEWMQEEMNNRLSEPQHSKSKVRRSKKEVIVRLPYDYEWIYAADASYAIIPDCDGYNTIYDPSEGLVENTFFKRTSQVSKREKKKATRIDELTDLNRFGMTENEMMAIFKEAMNFGGKKNDPSDPSFSGKMENCCLAGHVVELINTKDGGTTLRGCCWNDKEDYLKMAAVYKKFQASPFVGFRVVLVTRNGTYKEPFW